MKPLVVAKELLVKFPENKDLTALRRKRRPAEQQRVEPPAA